MSTYRKFKPFQVPKEWCFLDPDANIEFKHENINDLIVQIDKFRTQNRYDSIEHLKTVIENYTASKQEYKHITEPAKLNRGWMQYMKGGVSLFKNFFYGKSNIVSQETADKRALICTQCPLNVFPDKDGFLRWSDSIAENCTDGRKSQYYDQLGNCAACSCVLKAKVFFRGYMGLSKDEIDIIEKANPNCWQLTSIRKPDTAKGIPA